METCQFFIELWNKYESVQLRLLSAQIFISKVRVFLKIATICFIFWKAFDKRYPEKLFIFKSEALCKVHPDNYLVFVKCKNPLGVAVLRELILPLTGSLRKNLKFGLVGTQMYF